MKEENIKIKSACIVLILVTSLVGFKNKRTPPHHKK